MAKRKANIDVSRCVACGVCRLQCPREAISIFKGCYAVVNEDVCVGCGLCEKACPADAINLVEREIING
ncbi:MAG: 4Fe-4S binding protein [Pseudobutyrivibrio sp.]|nr:4Fe-4S binding protein [Pseudobutyrivibrio sp.]